MIRTADRSEEGKRIVIARQEQMIAIIDCHAERGIEIRTAAPARLPRGLVQNDISRAASKADRCSKPGKPRANNMHGIVHQRSP